jgi:hypothetical protein
MIDLTIALNQYLININMQDDADFLREGVELLSLMVMELEVSKSKDEVAAQEKFNL